MKTLMKSLVLALFLANTSEAYKLMQQNMNRIAGNDSEDIDADDQDINDGPLKNENDLLTY